jgi:hypothetical protein
LKRSKYRPRHAEALMKTSAIRLATAAVALALTAGT